MHSTTFLIVSLPAIFLNKGKDDTDHAPSNIVLVMELNREHTELVVSIGRLKSNLSKEASKIKEAQEALEGRSPGEVISFKGAKVQHKDLAQEAHKRMSKCREMETQIEKSSQRLEQVELELEKLQHIINETRPLTGEELKSIAIVLRNFLEEMATKNLFDNQKNEEKSEK